MSPSKPRGLRQRIWRGWKLGFAQRDTFVIGGTLLLLVQLFAIRALATRSHTARSMGGLSERIARSVGAETPPRLVDLTTPRGTAGWITQFSADLTPTPAYNLRARRVPAFAPVRITGVTADQQYVRVAAVVSHVATGKTLVIAGRIRKPEFMAGVSGDYLLVRGGARPMWLFAANATEPRD